MSDNPPALASGPERQRAIDATAWFSMLMHAQMAHNSDEAALAQHELARLGVAVKLRSPDRRTTRGRRS